MRVVCMWRVCGRTLALYSYSYDKSDAVEPLIEVDDDKQAPSVRANAHIQCFLGCCELAVQVRGWVKTRECCGWSSALMRTCVLQLLRAGCSSGPVAPPTADILTILADTCALRVHAQVQANPGNVAFTVGARDGELPKLSLARIEPIIQVRRQFVNIDLKRMLRDGVYHVLLGGYCYLVCG